MTTHLLYNIPLCTKHEGHAWNIVYSVFYANEILFYFGNFKMMILCVAFPLLSRIEFSAKIKKDNQGYFYMSIIYHATETEQKMIVFQSIELDCAKIMMRTCVYPRKNLPTINSKMVDRTISRIKSKINKCDNQFGEEYEQLYVLFNKMCAIKYSGFMNHQFDDIINAADVKFIYWFLANAVLRPTQPTRHIVLTIIKMVKSDVLIDSELISAKSIVNTIRMTNQSLALRAEIEHETNKYHVNAAALVLCQLK